jgi:poly-gamma-glutamate capsule biosynthesis protein CapA/YwtB (metallophosphatase superfamily)
VDVIFGHHPHVLQPFEWIHTSDGRRTFVVYSLGNFISGQKNNYKDIGGLVTLQVTKTVDPDGERIELLNPEFYPTYVTNQNNKNYKVVPLSEASQHGLHNAENISNDIIFHMYQWVEK